MKKYKDLRKQLNEGENMDGGVLGGYPAPNSTRSAVSDDGIYRVEKPEQLKRIQAFLNAFTGREYLDPRAALSLLRVKLNLAGLDFDFNKKTELKINQPITLKMNRFGGAFGKSVTTPHDQFDTTDGLESPLNLIVSINEAPSGLYKLEAKIAGHSESSEQGAL
jgi:hypothetical protein